MTEVTLWNVVRPAIFQRLGLDPVRVENGLGTGTPDVNYVHGWVELKEVPAWPMRSQWPVRVEFQREQCAWLARRWLMGGLCFVLLRVEDQLMLFDGWSAQRVRDGLSRRELEAVALVSTQTRDLWRSDIDVWNEALTGRLDLWPERWLRPGHRPASVTAAGA